MGSQLICRSHYNTFLLERVATGDLSRLCTYVAAACFSVILSRTLAATTSRRPWLNIFMPFFLVCVFGGSAGWSNSVMFLLALVAIIPFAERLGYVTEQVRAERLLVYCRFSDKMVCVRS